MLSPSFTANEFVHTCLNNKVTGNPSKCPSTETVEQYPFNTASPCTLAGMNYEYEKNRVFSAMPANKSDPFYTPYQSCISAMMTQNRDPISIPACEVFMNNVNPLFNAMLVQQNIGCPNPDLVKK